MKNNELSAFFLFFFFCQRMLGILAAIQLIFEQPTEGNLWPNNGRNV